MIPELIAAILSSGTLATLLTLRATRRKATAQAKSVEIDNNQKLLDNFHTFILKPLKQEVNEVRNNIRQLQAAISEIANCPNRSTCPVADRLDQLLNDKTSQHPDHSQPTNHHDPV